MSQKVNADTKRGAKENDIVPGDQVLLKNTKATGKLAPNFESEPYTVKANEGHDSLYGPRTEMSTGEIVIS